VLANHTGNSFQPTYSSASNRFSSIPGASVSYDANGNVLTDGSHTYAWDADGNSVSLDSVGLTFDALDRMVEQNRSGTYTEIVYSPGGAKLALMSGTGGQTLQKAFVPLPGQATAIYTSSGLDHYRHSDWLGSARLTSSPTRTVLSTTAYAPFAETYAQSGTPDPSFTGQNQDTVSGDYDFLYREYSDQGRWPSPDPAGLAAVDPSNPQSWNRYAYVLGNPVAYVDPLGLCGGGDGDTGAPCSPFSYIDGNGCITTVTYQKEKGSDGNIYDIPVFTTTCSLGCPSGNFVPVPFSGGRCVPGHILGDFARERRDRERGNSSWWGTFATSFFRDFSLKGAKQQGETWSACVDRAQEALLGKTGTTALNVLTPLGAGATLYTTPFTQSTDLPGVGVTRSFWEADLAANARSGTGLANFATKASGPLSKALGIVTAVATGVKGGFYVACAH